MGKRPGEDPLSGVKRKRTPTFTKNHKVNQYDVDGKINAEPHSNTYQSSDIYYSESTPERATGPMVNESYNNDELPHKSVTSQTTRTNSNFENTSTENEGRTRPGLSKVDHAATEDMDVSPDVDAGQGEHELGSQDIFEDQQLDNYTTVNPSTDGSEHGHLSQDVEDGNLLGSPLDRVSIYKKYMHLMEPEVAKSTLDFLSSTSSRSSSPPLSTDNLSEEKNIPQDDEHFDFSKVTGTIYRWKMDHMISEGAFGIVYKARDTTTGEAVAVKRLKTVVNKNLLSVDGKIQNDYPDEGIIFSCRREVKILRRFQHDNIIKLREIVTNNDRNSIFLILEYAEFDMGDLVDVMDSHFTVSHTKRLLKDLIQALHFMHSEGYAHRDIKMSNLLLNYKGVLKLCDFGLARKIQCSSQAFSIDDNTSKERCEIEDEDRIDRRHECYVAKLTPGIVTLWYRPPEVLLNIPTYSTKVDIWSAGCIAIHLLTGKVPFPGRGELDQIRMIFKLLGSPTAEQWPEYKTLNSVRTMRFVDTPRGGGIEAILNEYLDEETVPDSGLDLLNGMLEMNPSRRLNASQILGHDFFSSDSDEQDTHSSISSRKDLMEFVAEKLRANQEEVSYDSPDTSVNLGIGQDSLDTEGSEI